VKKKSILIVDDHPLVREGLKVILGRTTKFEVVGEAGTAAEGFRMAQELTPDLVSVDISLPDESGIELTRRIKSALPTAGILIVSMHSKIDYITEAFKAGATGYILKESAPEGLLSALETIAKGEYYLDSPLSHPVIEKLIKSPEKDGGNTDGAYRSLTTREQEIMRMLAKDLSVKEIAKRLFISAKTVENHRTNIKYKLGLKSSIELARYAVRLGFIDVDEWKN
jgi:DNA-binding NarL/FixJ family response regulator